MCALCRYGLASAAALQDAKLSPADRSGLSEQHARRALELLAKAQAAGDFRQPAAVERLKKDPALAPLRCREDFSKWLRSLGP